MSRRSPAPCARRRRALGRRRAPAPCARRRRAPCARRRSPAPCARLEVQKEGAVVVRSQEWKKDRPQYSALRSTAIQRLALDRTAGHTLARPSEKNLRGKTAIETGGTTGADSGVGGRSLCLCRRTVSRRRLRRSCGAASVVDDVSQKPHSALRSTALQRLALDRTSAPCARPHCSALRSTDTVLGTQYNK